MAKQNNEVKATVNQETEMKEEKTMVQQENAPVQEQQAQPVAQPAAQNVQVPAEVPAEETQKTFWEKHPKAKAAAEKGKKWGKRLAIGAAFIGGLFVAHKLGEAAGFDKASDAYNNRQSGNDPEPDESSDNNDLGEADFEEVDSTES